MRRWVCGEAVEVDAGAGVGEAESLEGAEHVASGRLGGAVLGQQPGSAARRRGRRLRSSVSISPKTSSAMPTMLSQRVDAVVVVQEDRAHLERLLEVAVAALDDLLALVACAASRPAVRRRSGEVGGERVDRRRPSPARGDRLVVALPADRRLALAGAPS